MSRDNLVVLAYCSNTCYIDLTPLRNLESSAKRMNSVNPKDLKIDLWKKTWSFLKWQNIPIGNSRGDLEGFDQARWGIIGVYDHSVFGHVKRLMYDSQRAVERSVSVLED